MTDSREIVFILDTPDADALREEFIETLNQEFFSAKGYGVYAYLSTMEVIRLFEQFSDRGVSAKTFAKEFVRLF